MYWEAWIYEYKKLLSNTFTSLYFITIVRCCVPIMSHLSYKWAKIILLFKWRNVNYVSLISIYGLSISITLAYLLESVLNENSLILTSQIDLL